MTMKGYELQHDTEYVEEGAPYTQRTIMHKGTLVYRAEDVNYFISYNEELRRDVDALKHNLRVNEKLYLDLILLVGKKTVGETRHETARRYILNAENTGSCQAGQAIPRPPVEKESVERLPRIATD